MKLIPNWRQLWKAWSVQAAAVGLALPGVLQIVADNAVALPWLDDETKSAIRLGSLAAIPILRALQQHGAADVDR